MSHQTPIAGMRQGLGSHRLKEEFRASWQTGGGEGANPEAVPASRIWMGQARTPPHSPSRRSPRSPLGRLRAAADKPSKCRALKISIYYTLGSRKKYRAISG